MINFINSQTIKPVYEIKYYSYEYLTNIGEDTILVEAKIPARICPKGYIPDAILNLLQYPSAQNKLKLLLRYDIDVSYKYAVPQYKKRSNLI